MTPRARAFLVASVLVLAAVAILGWSKLHAGPALASKASAPTLAASPPNLRKARAETPALFRKALDLGATISVTADKASFTVLWSPADPKATIVFLHGHKSTAFTDFSRWQSYAEQRGYAVLGIQWRLGSAPDAEYSPAQIYAIAKSALERREVKQGGAILQGFSSSAVRSYPIVALDRRSKKYFGLAIANAGAILPGLPANQLLLDGVYGARPLAGSRWVLYCGTLDPNVDYAGCAQIQLTAAKIKRLGATVVKIIRDRSGKHGDFIKKLALVNAALDAYKTPR